MDVNQFLAGFRSMKEVKILTHCKAKGHRDEVIARLQERNFDVVIDESTSDGFYIRHHKFFEMDENEEIIRQKWEEAFAKRADTSFELKYIEVVVEDVMMTKAGYSLDEIQKVFSQK